MRISVVRVVKLSSQFLSLAADGSDTLLQLIEQNRVHVDYLKVGPWIGTDKMLQCAANYSVLLHCNTSLIDPKFTTETLIDLVAQTNPPWLSLHLNLPDTPIYKLWLRAGIPFPIVQRTIALKRAIQNFNCLESKLDIPILIENQAHHRHAGHDYLADLIFITQFIAATNAYLLLDLGHARVSAAMRDETARAYLNQLPLDQVHEIHISGAGIYRGRLRDLHQPLSAADYDLLRFTIPHCPNLKVVTLEFYGSPEQLIDQLTHLQSIIRDYSASPITRTS